MRHHWGLDLGTSNTGLSRWSSALEKPEFILLPDVCRNPTSEDPLEAPRLVPSTTFLVEAPRGLSGFLRRRTLWGQDTQVGRQANEQNEHGLARAYVPNFKTQLMHEPERPLARFGGSDVTAREIARRYVRELCRQVKRVTGDRIEEITVATPVEAFEAFRVEITQALLAARVKRVRFVDEPVAAAMGYGLSLAQDEQVLVVDIGGGTMHVANIALSVKGARGGGCRVVAKSGRSIGGNVVDKWLLDAFCEKLDFDLTPPRGSQASDQWERIVWHRFTLEEARRVKEALFFKEEESFLITPPESLRRGDSQKKADTLRVRRDDIVGILRERGFYSALTRCIDEVLAVDARVDDVLVVGGSTLLPGVYKLLEERFGRDRVRAWLPFEAVSYGACVFAAGAFEHHDYVLHDYAIVTHNAQTKQKEYTVIVPRGTRFPTPGPVWQQKLVPTCALGEPETFFKLVVCEIGRASDSEMRLHFDEAGNLKKLGRQSGDSVIVPLNEENPTLGTINPPHEPTDRRPRLEVGFTVNADRWLCVRVDDLLSKKRLLDDVPVVRVL